MAHTLHDIATELTPHANKAEKQPASREYDKCLPSWRAHARQQLVDVVERESEFIAKIQRAIQNPILNAYFTYSSILGTDHFFILSLPMFFFFGHDDLGRGLLIVLGIGSYASSCLKDLFCSPRPFSPPVTRLTVLNHHLEYGFPSTHTTHSFSIALYLCSNTATPYYWTLGVYAMTIILGRVYLGMHTFTDCFMGLILGTMSVLLHSLSITRIAEQWIFNGGMQTPIVVLSIFLVMLELLPMPVDDCPCHDDAVLSGSVATGALLGRWAFGAPKDYGTASLMPGSGWELESGVWTPTSPNTLLWYNAALAKVLIGILIVFLWRLLAKRILREVWKWIRVPSRSVLGVGNQPICRHRTDSLTKVIVYIGIAVLSCEVVPDLFVTLGLGVRSWPS